VNYQILCLLRYTKALDTIKSLRKDRVAELKAEKERLESLSREKTHSDKLKSRIGDLNATIASKEAEYEETKKIYEQLVISNTKFYDFSTKFREMYVKVEELQKTKTHYEQELSELRIVTQEVGGTVKLTAYMRFQTHHLGFLDTDSQLADRMANFDQHISQRKQDRRQEDSKRQDIEDELIAARKAHVDLVNVHGQLEAEAKVYIELL
jgi:DNA repair protein RAD50